MITKWLLWFGLAVVDLDLIARALASDVLRVHEVDMLDQPGTLRELRQRYARIAVETGLPVEAQARAAEMAWRYITAAQDAPQGVVNHEGFSFY